MLLWLMQTLRDAKGLSQKDSFCFQFILITSTIILGKKKLKKVKKNVGYTFLENLINIILRGKKMTFHLQIHQKHLICS